MGLGGVEAACGVVGGRCRNRAAAWWDSKSSQQLREAERSAFL